MHNSYVVVLEQHFYFRNLYMEYKRSKKEGRRKKPSVLDKLHCKVSQKVKMDDLLFPMNRQKKRYF